MDSSSLDLAKQGDSKEIAKFISRSINDKALNVKARNNNGCLETILRSKDLVHEEDITSEIYTIISRLKPNNISQFLIIFYCGSETSPRWRHGFQIDEDGSIKTLTHLSQTNHSASTNSSTSRQSVTQNKSHPVINFLLSRNGERCILIFSTFMITNLVWLGLYNPEKEVASNPGSNQSLVTSEVPTISTSASNPSSSIPVPQPVQPIPVSTPRPVTSETSNTNSEVDDQSSPSPVPQPIQETPVAEPVVQPQASVTSEPEPVVDTSAEAFLTNFLDSITTTSNDGTSAWCQSKEILVTSFFSPRAYTILSFSEYGNSFYASVRVESSNKGGSPIIATWSFYGDKESAIIPDPSYHGWCISLINESS